MKLKIMALSGCLLGASLTSAVNAEVDALKEQLAQLQDQIEKLSK